MEEEGLSFPWLFWVVSVVWLIGVLVSWYYGARKVPAGALVIGAVMIALSIFSGVNIWITVGVIAILAALIWITNSTDITRL